MTTVLVVDDNADMRAYVRRHLETRYRVVEAVNGRIALEQARTLLPDLIISDVMMPELDGYGLCRALKADPELDFIPVILLTAKASEDSLIAGLEEGADAYVTTPFSVRELGARVDQLIAKGHRLKERLQALAQGDGLVDPAMGPAPSEEEAFLAEVRRVIAEHVADEGFGVEERGGVCRGLPKHGALQPPFPASVRALALGLRRATSTYGVGRDTWERCAVSSRGVSDEGSPSFQPASR